MNESHQFPLDEPAAHHGKPLHLKLLSPDAVRTIIARDPRLIVPVGTTEQHGPHLPFGADTIIVERLADDLSAAFGVLRAPTVEYGVNVATRTQYAGNATVRRKTLHRFMNDLIGTWEAGGIRQFIILTAHGYDPHQEALSTLRTTDASIRSVDIFTVPLHDDPGSLPIHGGEIDTSLLLYLAPELVALGAARDYVPSRRGLRGYRRAMGTIPKDSPGSMGRPTQATADRGRQLYELIYERLATRVFPRASPSEAEPE